ESFYRCKSFQHPVGPARILVPFIYNPTLAFQLCCLRNRRAWRVRSACRVAFRAAESFGATEYKPAALVECGYIRCAQTVRIPECECRGFFERGCAEHLEHESAHRLGADSTNVRQGVHSGPAPTRPVG